MRRTSSKFASALVGTALAFGLPAAPAHAGSTDYLLELGGVQGETDDKHKDQIEILSYSWGATRADGGGQYDALTDGLMILRNTEPKGTASTGGVRVAAGDVNGDGRADVGASEKVTVGGAQASGQATGKRQHMPLRSRNYYAAPLAKGSLTLRGKFPSCAVGARYPSITLGGKGKRYVLHEVVVASCGGSASGDRPMEEVSFNYGKITF